MFIHITSPKGQGELPANRGLTFLKWFANFTFNAIMFIVLLVDERKLVLFYFTLLLCQFYFYHCENYTIFVTENPQCRAECLHANAYVSHVKI